MYRITKLDKNKLRNVIYTSTHKGMYNTINANLLTIISFDVTQRTGMSLVPVRKIIEDATQKNQF